MGQSELTSSFHIAWQNGNSLSQAPAKVQISALAQLIDQVEKAEKPKKINILANNVQILPLLHTILDPKKPFRISSMTLNKRIQMMTADKLEEKLESAPEFSSLSDLLE